MKPKRTKQRCLKGKQRSRSWVWANPWLIQLVSHNCHLNPEEGKKLRTGHYSLYQQLVSSRLKLVIPGVWQAALAHSHAVIIWLLDFFSGLLTKGLTSSCRGVMSAGPSFNVTPELISFSHRKCRRLPPQAPNHQPKPLQFPK